MSKIITHYKTYTGKMDKIFLEIFQDLGDKSEYKFIKYALKNLRVPSEVVLRDIDSYYFPFDEKAEISKEDLIINNDFTETLKDFRAGMFVYELKTCKDILQVIDRANKQDLSIKIVSKIKKIDFEIEDKYGIKVDYNNDILSICRLKK